MTVAALVIVAACTWAEPGRSPFTGDRAAAVEHYADIAPATRERLRSRIARRDYDDIAEITRDRIVGRSEYADLRAMHFGTGRVCNTVDRSSWSPAMRERGLVYCEDGACVIVPTICGNLSRVTRVFAAVAPAAIAPLDFAAPGAGPGYALAALPADAPPTFAALAEPTYPARPVFWWPGVDSPGRSFMAVPTAPVPELATWLLLSGGLVLVACAAWSQMRKDSMSRDGIDGLEVTELGAEEGARTWQQSGGEPRRAEEAMKRRDCATRPADEAWRHTVLQQAYERHNARRVLSIAPAEAVSAGPSCSGACDGGRRSCPAPAACELAEWPSCSPRGVAVALFVVALAVIASAYTPGPWW